MIDITQIIEDKHPFMQTIIREYIHPNLHYYCMEVETPNYGKVSSYSMKFLKEESLAKYISMISLAVEYLDHFGANHGKINYEHIFLNKNVENGEITFKLSNIRS